MKKLKNLKKQVKPLGVLFSCAFIFLAFFCAFFAEYLSFYDISKGNVALGLCPLSYEHPFGCDLYGIDILSQIIMGSRTSLLVSLCVVGLSTIIGCFVGSVAAILGGWVDVLFLQVTESFMALPSILLFICLGSLIDMSALSLILALSFTGWMGIARLVRAKLLECREYDYLLSAKALGVGPLRLVSHYFLPNLYGPLLVTSVFGISGVILTESTLSFLGLGIQGTASWGLLLHQGRSVLLEAPHLSLVPGACIFFLILSLNLIGDHLGKKRGMSS